MEDEAIIALYFDRDEAAILETAKKYGKYLHTISLRILQNEDDAEESVNDTYHGAWRSMPPTRPSILRLFLARIARNVSIDRLEYRLAGKRRSDQEVLLSEVSEILPSGFNVEETCQGYELGETINRFLRELDAAARIMFVSRYWYAQSIREIAEAQGLSESCVKSSLFRTRKKLRVFLEKEGIPV